MCVLIRQTHREKARHKCIILASVYCKRERGREREREREKERAQGAINLLYFNPSTKYVATNQLNLLLFCDVIEC